MCFMYKVSNYMVPDYITDLFPPIVQERTMYSLRNSNDVTYPYCRTSMFQKSCIPSSILLWNSLNMTLREAPSFTSFKKTLNLRNHTPVPSYYIYGDRNISVIHARIRNNCSNLHADLYNNHLNLSPTCSCGAMVEDAEHFFLCVSEIPKPKSNAISRNKILSSDKCK